MHNRTQGGMMATMTKSAIVALLVVGSSLSVATAQAAQPNSHGKGCYDFWTCADSNRDGLVTNQERDVALASCRVISTRTGADFNRDGLITRQEAATRLTYYRCRGGQVIVA